MSIIRNIGDKLGISTLMDGDALANRMLTSMPGIKNLIILSAYVTSAATSWIRPYVSGVGQKVIIGRLAPRDFLSGASDINALRELLDTGWELKCLSNLHAKVYLINNHSLFVGSANLTSNGLKLSGAGNIEAVLEKVAEQQDLIFINKIVNSATTITYEILDNMETLLVNASNDIGIPEWQTWPEDMFSCARSLLVSDLPLTPPSVCAEEYLSNPSLPFAIINKLEGNVPQAAVLFKKSRAFKWLLNVLIQAEGNQMYFGAITASLHNSVADDPAPYRQSVKDMLSNLLQYIEYLKIEDIEITRPSHSQLVRLL